jgi:hypothetical protein
VALLAVALASPLEMVTGVSKGEARKEALVTALTAVAMEEARVGDTPPVVSTCCELLPLPLPLVVVVLVVLPALPALPVDVPTPRALALITPEMAVSRAAEVEGGREVEMGEPEEVREASLAAVVMAVMAEAWEVEEREG